MVSVLEEEKKHEEKEVPGDSETNDGVKVGKESKDGSQDSHAMFYVYLWDPRSNKSNMEKFVAISGIANVMGTSLADIRKKLIGGNALEWRQKSSKFCNAAGAVVEDTLRFAKYLDFLTSTKDEGQEVQDPEGEESHKKTPHSQLVHGEKDGVKWYTVYLKLRKIATELDQETRDFVKKKLEFELSRPDTLDAGTNMLASSYANQDFMAVAGSSAGVHPADMGEREWYIVLQNNSILNGSYVRELNTGERKVERAMYPALTLKPRRFHDFEVIPKGGPSGDSSGDKPDPEDAKDNSDPGDAKDKPNPKVSDDPDPTMYHLRIPRFLVQDDSYVNVSENKSSVANAIADSSLSETSAEASVGGGAFGVTAGVKVEYKAENSVKTASKVQTDKKRMTITYNFPRVVLELDGDSLDLSDECKESLKAIKTKQDVDLFKRKYGTFFATRIELGGRLHSTEETEAFSEETVGKRASSMKVAAAASFSSAWVQGSAGYSQGNATNNSTTNQNSGLNMNLTWEAKGGDTLLCNNPAAWCSTVASYYNWRVVKQEDLLRIEDMISIIPGFEGTKQRFLELDPPGPIGIAQVTMDRGPPPSEWEGWLTFWLQACNESKYPAVVSDTDGNYSNGSMTMTVSASDSSQYFQAGERHTVVYDGKTVKYRFMANQPYMLWSNKTGRYITTTLDPKKTTPTYQLRPGATWEDSCYFRFSHAFPSEKPHIDHNDLVRIEAFNTKEQLVGYVRDAPPMSATKTGDIFHMRYQNA